MIIRCLPFSRSSIKTLRELRSILFIIISRNNALQSEENKVNNALHADEHYTLSTELDKIAADELNFFARHR
jgi:hypothetical protein